MRRLLLVVLAGLVVGCGEPAPVARVRSETKSITLPHGACVPVRFGFDMLAPLEDLQGSPTVFVHLYHHDRRTQRTFDHAVPFPWQPGRGGRDEFLVCHSALARPIPADPYVLRVGLYDSRSGERWPLETGGEQLARFAYGLTDVTVPLEKLPGRYTFSGRWEEADTVGDQQHPSHRILHGPGTVSVEGAPAPGHLVARFEFGERGALVDVGKGPYAFGPGSHLVRAPLTNGAATVRLQPRSGTAKLLIAGVERLQ